MARGSEGPSCRARKRPWSKVCVRESGRRPPSRLRHLPAAGPARPWSKRRGRGAPLSNVAMTAGTSLRPREDARGRADAPNFLGDGARERSSQMTSTPIALSRAFWGVGVGAGREILARAGKGPIAKYEKENPGDLSATYPTDVKLSPFHFTPRNGLQVSPASIGLQSRTVLPLPRTFPPRIIRREPFPAATQDGAHRDSVWVRDYMALPSAQLCSQPGPPAAGMGSAGLARLHGIFAAYKPPGLHWKHLRDTVEMQLLKGECP